MFLMMSKIDLHCQIDTAMIS